MLEEAGIQSNKFKRRLLQSWMPGGVYSCEGRGEHDKF